MKIPKESVKHFIIVVLGATMITTILHFAGIGAVSTIREQQDNNDTQTETTATIQENQGDNNGNIQTEKGVIISCTYDEQKDMTVTEIITVDGNIWVVEDYTAPVGDKVDVVFNTNGTDDMMNDIIVKVICYSEISNK